MDIQFEWDAEKARINRQKHHISFEIAARVFADPRHLSVPDRVEGGEHRWQTIGMVDGRLILLVAHTVMEKDGQEIIRIISARKANRRERSYYGQNGQI